MRVFKIDGVHCGICGEHVEDHEEQAEMYDPNKPEMDSVFCHAQCGVMKGYEVA